MTKKPTRMLPTPLAKSEDHTSIGRALMSTKAMGLPRVIRRPKLRLIVPIADSSIYEMEQRGEFPRRFYLSSRCVAWDLGEVEAWLRQRRADSDAGHIRKAPAPDIRLRKTRPMKER